MPAARESIYPEGELGVVIALARLGRWDDAVAQLRILAKARGDTALALGVAEIGAGHILSASRSP